MHFPDKSPKIDPARFTNNSRVIYTDKDGNDHNATVLSSFFKSLLTGYVYAIELDEPLNGFTKYQVNEKRLNPAAKPEKVKKEKKERKPRKSRKAKEDAEA